MLVLCPPSVPIVPIFIRSLSKFVAIIASYIEYKFQIKKYTEKNWTLVLIVTKRNITIIIQSLWNFMREIWKKRDRSVRLRYFVSLINTSLNWNYYALLFIIPWYLSRHAIVNIMYSRYYRISTHRSRNCIRPRLKRTCVYLARTECTALVSVKFACSDCTKSQLHPDLSGTFAQDLCLV